MDYKDLSTDIEEDITEEITESEVSVSDAGRKGGLEVFLNAGVAIGAGESNEVLRKPGISTELSADYWFSTSIGLLGLGAEASVNLYPYAGPTGEAGLVMLPMGLNLAYSTPTEKLFAFLFQIGSGPAIVVLVFEEAEPLVKVLPYISGTGSISLNFRKRIGFGLKAKYSIYFEEAGMLTTLTPSIYVSFRSWD